MRFSLALLVLLFPLAALAADSGRPVVADVSQHTIELHARFNGQDLLLFGARNTPGEIVALLRGPERDFIVRQKERIGGIWMHTASKTYHNVPDFFMLAASHPAQIAQQQRLMEPLRLSLAYLVPEANKDNAFYQALLRNRSRLHHYFEEPQDIQYLEETLFKTSFPLPGNLPRGEYSMEIYLLHNGSILGSEILPIYVYKTGMDAYMYDMAYNHPAIYGLLAVMLAACMGWFANYIFERAT